MDAEEWLAKECRLIVFDRGSAAAYRSRVAGYAPGVTTSTICGIILPVIRSHEILMLVTRPAWTRSDAFRSEDLNETSPPASMSNEMQSPFLTEPTGAPFQNTRTLGLTANCWV